LRESDPGGARPQRCPDGARGQMTRICEVDITRVWMRDDPAEREAYLRSRDWQGKAGAYGIQDVGDRLVARIEGSFSNVVGLPLERVARMLAAAGLPAQRPGEEVAAGAPRSPRGRAAGQLG
ncbi:MAG: Maf family protein, partial [Planctomycetota bacterium]